MTPPARPISRPDVDVRRARTAVAVLFFTNGALFANLIPRYPAIKADLGLSNAEFGLAIAAFPLGALIAGLAAGMLIRRFRSSRVAVVSTMLTAVGLILAGVAPGWAALALGIFLAGAMDSITDVAQNSHGLRVQRLYQRSILNSFHAVWSIGAVTGGLLGAAAAQLDVPRGTHLIVSAVTFSMFALVAYRSLLHGPEPVEPTEPPASAPTDPAAGSADVAAGGAAGTSPARSFGRLGKWLVLGALVVIAASGALVEDAGSTWSAIFLSDSLGTSALLAGFGFIALQGMQFIGRMLGDRFVDRFGQRAVARTGGAIVFLGMGTALAFPSVAGIIVGFGLAGFGVATLIPAAMHAADELPGFRTGTGLTIVAWLLRLGFLVSPPIVGFIADLSALRYGLLVVPLAGLLVVLFAPVLATRVRPRATDAAPTDEPELASAT
ncbi:MFS transporter [Cryobacterium sp. SO2]|uniref:MFS transporter n=1 Tax=Cryobacterium sp. SO2 TaxID=1897060 RepID=UPI00223E0697|nr:MFS transporter [Cryobacterium sp. SO2]WEO76346.1 MFS transporter [Cryobacterium sp. SO2]